MSNVSKKVFFFLVLPLAALAIGLSSPNAMASAVNGAETAKALTANAALLTELSSELGQLDLVNRVGGGVSPAVLPHHRTYRSVYGGSMVAL